jgi:hypothetical protein
MTRGRKYIVQAVLIFLQVAVVLLLWPVHIDSAEVPRAMKEYADNPTEENRQSLESVSTKKRIQAGPMTLYFRGALVLFVVMNTCIGLYQVMRKRSHNNVEGVAHG